MKKRIKSIVSVILVLAVCCSLAVAAFAEENLGTITNINEAYKLISDTEEIAIYSATLYEDGVTGKDVYYVVCHGLDTSEKDLSKPRSLANAIRVGLSDENNDYITKLVRVINETVPEDSSLVFSGHSLGGMVIQQAIARKDLKEKYKILYTVSIGSPYILTSRAKAGKYIRIVDLRDPVPYLSIPLLANPYMGNVAIEISDQPPLVHLNSYEYGDCWKCYDCVGTKNGSAKIVLNACLYEDVAD